MKPLYKLFWLLSVSILLVQKTACASSRNAMLKDARLLPGQKNVVPHGLPHGTQAPGMIMQRIRGGGDFVLCRFEVRVEQKQPGDSVVLLGNTDTLQKWDLNKAIQMKTTDHEFPWWSAVVQQAVGDTIEYKFAIQSTEGSLVWESGSNRIVIIPDDYRPVFSAVFSEPPVYITSDEPTALDPTTPYPIRQWPADSTDKTSMGKQALKICVMAQAHCPDSVRRRWEGLSEEEMMTIVDLRKDADRRSRQLKSDTHQARRQVPPHNGLHQTSSNSDYHGTYGHAHAGTLNRSAAAATSWTRWVTCGCLPMHQRPPPPAPSVSIAMRASDLHGETVSHRRMLALQRAVAGLVLGAIMWDLVVLGWPHSRTLLLSGEVTRLAAPLARRASDLVRASGFADLLAGPASEQLLAAHARVTATAKKAWHVATHLTHRLWLRAFRSGCEKDGDKAGRCSPSSRGQADSTEPPGQSSVHGGGVDGHGFGLNNAAGWISYIGYWAVSGNMINFHRFLFLLPP